MKAKGALVGVIHLPALPGSPNASRKLADIVQEAVASARVLEDAGYEVCMLENYGDVPFYRGEVPPITIAAMSVVAQEVRRAVGVPLGINVLRNDARAALAIAHVVSAAVIRVNVLTGARVTDQGVVEGNAALLLRERAALGGGGPDGVAIWADVDVKHSGALGALQTVAQETSDLVVRALADAVLVTGEGTGHAVDTEKLAAVARAARANDREVSVLVASGATIEALPTLAKYADGVIVGSALRANGKAGGPIDPRAAGAFAEAFRKAFAR